MTYCNIISNFQTINNYIGAIATSTAPASTMMTINQYKARGEFVNILLQVVALDDVICLIIFSIIIAFINTTETGNISPIYVILPIIYNIGALGVGFLFAIILSKLLTPNRSNDNRLILAIASLLGISGLCSIFDISPILSLFFIISGINLDMSSLGTLGLVGIAYFLIRIIGKYIGAYLGCFITSTDKKICNYLGIALIPQAGVSIGLAFLGQRILPVDIGNRMMTIILASSVLYELVGSACAKLALIYSEAIKEDKI
ncbi:cation:proton antiporter [Tissierella praeacuta]|uniref:cation:proton antiporter n=1 Tax=Tissierella praeacuta TaxID=43131 RepID=UPI0028990A2C|nr:cation:proton antiporter [Tissierella praeacuta]